jgi:hypothetical protein
MACGSLLLAACADNSPLGITSEDAASSITEFRSDNAASSIKVMSRNMYFGAQVEPILAAEDLESLREAVGDAWDTFVETDFPSRAAAMAREIAQTRPHLVGLQEAAIITRMDLQGGVIHFDFVTTLLDELDKRAVSYREVERIATTDVALPHPEGGGVLLKDYDVILARGDVDVDNADAANYAALIPVPPNDPQFVVLRGWTAVDAIVHGTTYRFVNTHLEAPENPVVEDLIQVPQVQELISILAEETLPLIVVGDFNSGPNSFFDPIPGVLPPGVPRNRGYNAMLAAGYTDLWTLKRGHREGDTCCHAGDLSNRRPTLDERIDLVFIKNFDVLFAVGNPRSGHALVQAKLVGNRVGDRRRAGVWPSDHAGLVARILFPNPGGVAND